MNNLAYHIRRITQVTPLYGAVFLVIVVALAVEIYINSDPDRLDWIDWWFWARQNLSQLTESGQLTGIVMSPVQGLFGQSYPVSSIFNPLWALAASIDDPVQAHRISTAFVFILYSVTIWFVATRLIETKVFVLFSVVVCLKP